MNKIQSLLTIMLLLLSPQALTSDCSVAYVHMQNGNYDSAYREFRGLAERGYPFYINIIADMHVNAQGVPASNLMAHIWYSLSAAQGDETGTLEKIALEKTLSSQQLADSRYLAKEYARYYLQPYIASWSLD